MRTILSALVALSILAGMAAVANAADGWTAEHFWQQQQENLP